MSDPHIYNNAALICLSKDSDGKVWVHLGVELRGNKLYLSSFGGAVDTDPITGIQENPIDALLREVKEESLGVFNEQLSFEQLADPNQTYSFSYTNLSKQSSSIIFTTLIEHPNSVEALQERFAQERNDRLFKINGKKFQSDAETETKQIRSVPWEDIKEYLAAYQEDPQATILSAEQPGIFLSIDRTTKQYDPEDKEKLVDYELLQKSGVPVERKIPVNLSLRKDIAGSLVKMLPLLEHRILDKPLNLEEDEQHFFGKSLRADEFCFFDEFLDTLPIKDIDEKNRKSRTRYSEHKPYTSRGTEIIDRNLKRQFGLAKQYTDKEKNEYTSYQSISYFSAAHGTPVFGWQKGRSARLLGIIGVDVLPNRLTIYDNGTVNRPYEGSNQTALLGRVQQQTASTNQLAFDIDELDKFKERVENSSQYNEILGRIRWNIEKSSVCVFSDNIQTRWIAINWASKMDVKLHALSDQAFQAGMISEDEYRGFKSHKTRITFYNYHDKVTGEFSESERQQDIKKALEIFDDELERKRRFSEDEFEFLLIVDDKDRLEEIIQDDVLMNKLLEHRQHIALDVIEKYKKLTGNSYTIKQPTELCFENISRQLLEMISIGDIQGFATDIHGRIKFSGEISYKDLSDMDLRCFNFSGTSFENVYFQNSQLSLLPEDTLHLENCDLSNVDTHQLDFSGSTISGYIVTNDETVNWNIFLKMSNPGSFLENFSQEELKVIARNNEEQRILHKLVVWACDNDLSILKIILNENKSYDLQNIREGFLVDMLLNRQDEIAKLFIEKGLPINNTNQFGTTPLIAAIQNNQIDIVNLLLANGSDIHACDNQKKNALYYAAEFRRWNVVKLLVERNIKVDAQDQNAVHAFFSAVHDDRVTLISSLLERDANFIHARNESGHKILPYAVGRKCFDLLLEKGADINAVDADGKSSLMIATRFHNIDCFGKLLDRSADVNIADNNGVTAAMIAATFKNSNLLERLIHKGADLNKRDKNSKTALMLAIQEWNLENVKLLIENNAEIDQTDCDGNTALMLAILMRKDDLAKILIAKDARSDIYNSDGKGALALAFEHNHKELFQLLFEKAPGSLPTEMNIFSAYFWLPSHRRIELIQNMIESGADINTQNPSGETLLMYAVKSNDEEMIDLLVCNKANLDLIDRDGNSALVLAMQKKNEKIARLLIQSGADINIKPQYGKSAFHLAIENGQESLAILLVEKGAIKNVDLKTVDMALKSGCNDLAQMLSLKIDPNFVDPRGNTMLMEAVRLNMLPMVKTLIAGGADVNAMNSAGQGSTVLMLARGKEKHDILEVLIENNVDMDARNKNGETALMRAAIMGSWDTVKLLIEKGADPDIKNNKGQTLFDCVYNEGHRKIVADAINTRKELEQSRKTPLLFQSVVDQTLNKENQVLLGAENQARPKIKK